MVTQRQTSVARKAERRRERRDRVSTDVVLFVVDPKDEETTILGQLLDVSPHGARFRTSKEVSLQSPVKFRHAGLGVGGCGTVRYCHWSPRGFEVGVEFQKGTQWRNPGEASPVEAKAVTVTD
jgi:hypothetical protein